jgi:hypothetical protein
LRTIVVSSAAPTPWGGAGIYWFDLGMIGFSVAIAGGFCLFAALSAAGMRQFAK